MIKPTVGRVVWVWTARSVRSHIVRDEDQPFSASVVHVVDERMISVAGFDHRGNHFSAVDIPLLQDGDPRPEAGSCTFAEWMPYQKGQAAKADLLEARENVRLMTQAELDKSVG